MCSRLRLVSRQVFIRLERPSLKLSPVASTVKPNARNLSPLGSTTSAERLARVTFMHSRSALTVVIALAFAVGGCSNPGTEVSPSPSRPALVPSLDARPVQEQLVAAVLEGDTEWAALALAAGADPSLYDPETVNGPLSLAITRDDLAMVELLLDAGAQVEWPEFGYTELEIAGTFAGADVVQALLATGADPNGVGVGIGGPLVSASYSDNVAALEVLLAAGADPNLFSEDAPRPTPPLFAAAYGGSHESALMLIDAGADVSLRSPDGYAPSDWADSQGHRELAELLRSLGG